MSLSTKKISELENLNSISNSDLLETTSLSSSIYSIYTSKKTTIEKFGIWLCSIFSFSQQLQTLTKTIIEAINEIFNKDTGEPTGAGFHNSIFRGEWLGAAPTEEQIEAINNGTFTNLFIGDYWCSNPSDDSSIKYRIAAFDYYYGIGETPCLTHHAVIVPDMSVLPRLHSGYYEDYSSRGGYKYASCRGYYHYTGIDYTTTQENQTVFNLNEIGQYPNIDFIVCVYMDDPTVSGQYIIWDTDGEPSGNDCIIKIKGGNFFHVTSTSSTYTGGIPQGTRITFDYKFKDLNSTTYPLIYWEYVINNSFVSSDYIMNFPLLATVDSTNQPGLVTTEWTEGKVEFMTEQQVTGARTIGINYNFETDILFINNHFQYNRKRFETTVDSIQFPLFKLNPIYKQNRSIDPTSYAPNGTQIWLRDKTFENDIKWTDGLSTIKNPGGYATNLYYSGSWSNPVTHYASGIRPYFCLAKPQS